MEGAGTLGWEVTAGCLEERVPVLGFKGFGSCECREWGGIPKKAGPENSRRGTCCECHSPTYLSKRAPHPSSATGSHLMGTHPAPAGTQASVRTNSAQARWAGLWLCPSRVPRAGLPHSCPAPRPTRPVTKDQEVWMPQTAHPAGKSQGALAGPSHWSPRAFLQLCSWRSTSASCPKPQGTQMLPGAPCHSRCLD